MSTPRAPEEGRVNVRVEMVNGKMVVKILGYEGGMSCSLKSKDLVEKLAKGSPKGFGTTKEEPNIGLTGEGRVTQAYETPEQLRGGAEEAPSDPQADLPEWMKGSGNKGLDAGYGV